jgi:hypothetical protein
VVQVVERVVKVLMGHPGHLPPKRKDGLGTIVVAHDLSPTDTIGSRSTPSPASSPTWAAPPATPPSSPEACRSPPWSACATSAT